MMNKISAVQEHKLFLNDLRTDQGHGLNNDLEQVTIELKLDEVVRQHINKLKQQSIIPTQDDVASESTFEQALTEAISSSGMTKKFDSTFFSTSIQFSYSCSHSLLCLYSKHRRVIDFF